MQGCHRLRKIGSVRGLVDGYEAFLKMRTGSSRLRPHHIWLLLEGLHGKRATDMRECVKR